MLPQAFFFFTDKGGAQQCFTHQVVNELDGYVKCVVVNHNVQYTWKKCQFVKLIFTPTTCPQDIFFRKPLWETITNNALSLPNYTVFFRKHRINESAMTNEF